MALFLATNAMSTSRAARRRGVSAIVLAAGLSSRMGRSKPLLLLNGTPLLTHALNALRASDVAEIVVVLGAQADRVRHEIPLESTCVVVNPDFAQGMSTSIRAGLRAVSPDSDAFLIVLADQPLVSSSTYNSLVARLEATAARVLVPTFAGVRGNPVLLHRSLSSEVESITGDVGCRQVLAAHAEEVVEVPVDDPGVLVDIDTVEELHRVEAVMQRGTSLTRLVEHRFKD